MNIRERLITAMGGTPAAKALRVPPSWLDYSTPQTGGGWNIADTPTGWLQAADNVWARNCIRARASLVVSAPLKLYRYNDDGEEEEVEAHPVLDVLERVNPINDDKSSFRRGIAESRATFGRALVLKARGTSANGMELYRLPVQHITVEPSATAFVAGYRDDRTNEMYPRDVVIDLRYPPLDGSVGAYSPTHVALQAINAYNAQEASSRAIDRRGGRMGGIVGYDETSLAMDRERMAQAWDNKWNNPENAGRDAHMPMGTTYSGGAFSAMQMQRAERHMQLVKTIMAGYSVPPSLAGDYSDASVLANAGQQSKNIWDVFGLDELDAIAEGFNNGLLWMEWPGTYEAGLYLRHDLSGIPALQEDNNMKAERAAVLISAGIASVNEAREMVNLDRIEDAGADEVVRVTANTEQRSAAAQPEQPPPQMDDMSAKAMPTLLPIFDFVGMTATDAAGNVLGKIENVKRFGVHDGVKASSATPVVIVAGKAHSAEDVRVLFTQQPASSLNQEN